MKKIFASLALSLLIIPLFAQKSESNGWYVKGYTEDIAKAYFDSRYSLDLIEGIWQSNDGFKYSIERDVENGKRLSDTYRVIILESSSNGWEKTEIKGFITYSSVNGIYSLKYYTKDQNGKQLSSQNVLMVVEDPLLVSFNRIDGGGKIQLFKLYPKATEDGNGGNVNSSVLPSDKKWSGSSVVIGNRYLATNFHVVDGAKTLVITGVGESGAVEYSVEPIAIDKTNDLAILKVLDNNFSGFGTIPYGMLTSTSDVGTDVFVMGFPLIQAMGTDVKLTTGIISSKTGYQGDVSLYQISAPVQPGNSGGPLFDNRGNLIGIVNAGILDAENVGYAIKLGYLRNLVESCNDHIDFNSTNSIYNLSLAEKVKKLNSFVYLVKANSSSVSSSSSLGGNSNVGSTGVNSSSSQEYYRIAGQMMDDKKYDEAYEYAKKSVSAGANVENHYLRGLLACRYANEYEVAIESMNYCIEKQHRIKECNSILASSYYGMERYADAIPVYDKLLSLDRKDVNALYMRGLCKSNLGNVDAAIADYRSALKFEGIIDYDYGTIYNNMAFQYLEQDDLPNAQKNINIFR